MSYKLMNLVGDDAYIVPSPGLPGGRLSGARVDVGIDPCALITHSQNIHSCNCRGEFLKAGFFSFFQQKGRDGSKTVSAFVFEENSI